VPSANYPNGAAVDVSDMPLADAELNAGELAHLLDRWTSVRHDDRGPDRTQ
jgi:hypothetical protein